MPNNINPYLELAHGVLDDGDIDLSSESSSLAVPNESGSVPSGNAYPPQVRAYAFQLWVYDAARNPRVVADLLLERADIDVNPATIRRWSVVESWEDRAVGYHQSSAFSLRQATQATIDLGAVKAARALVDVLDDTTAQASARVKAAGFLLNMAGFVAQRGNQTVNLAFSADRHRLADASDEELERMAASYGQDHAGIDPPIEVNEYEQRIQSQQGGYEYGNRKRKA